jgi:hypothetical protein
MASAHRMITIVIPLHHKGGKFKNNTELRYTLRSLEKHLTEPFEVVIVGKVLPDWVQNVRHIKSNGGLKTALVDASKAYPKGFFWWYDDCCLLQDQTAEDLKITPATKRWQSAQTNWSRSLDKIKDRLHREGHEAWDYSRPHGPYWFDQAMVDEAFADWPGMAGKFPWESWILSKRKWPRRHGVVKQYYGAFRSSPAAHSIFLNYCDNGLTPELLEWLKTKFTQASRLEKRSLKTSTIEVHTIRFGEPWWLQLCAKTLDSWCLTHGHELKIWDQQKINPEYPSPKFCEVDMLRDFLQGGAEWLLYVDSDVYVAADAPASPTQTPGFWIREDLPGSGPRDFRRWCRRHLGARKREAAKWDYRNAGVWFCDRASAASLLQVIAEPYIEGCMEQHQFNWWLCQAASAGMHVGFLDRAWNGWAYEDEPAAFYHIAGKRKATRLQMFREKGFIPCASMVEPTFDMKKYPVPAQRDQSMDDRHIYALHTAACGEWDGSRIAVEIGSFKGHSTTALVEALNIGKLDHLHVIETSPTDELRAVLSLADPNKITLHTVPSWEASISNADFVFIDGDHRWPALLDTLKALAWGAKVICMHDSSAWPKLPHCWGAWNAAQALKGFEDRTWTEDNESRPGEHTYRGFFTSAKQLSALTT